jgi:hypothetical protein
VLEAEEFFSEGQKGSSAMPHKRNPVLTENLTGLARMVRAYALPAMENVALWHERDISHSSVERAIGPDATVTLDFALARLTGVIDKLLIYPETMRRNLDRLGGLVHSQRVLLALTQAGVSREDAYSLVQRNAMPVWRGEGDFLALLKADPEIAERLTPADLETCSTSAITPSTSTRSSSGCSGGHDRAVASVAPRSGDFAGRWPRLPPGLAPNLRPRLSTLRQRLAKSGRCAQQIARSSSSLGSGPQGRITGRHGGKQSCRRLSGSSRPIGTTRTASGGRPGSARP